MVFPSGRSASIASNCSAICSGGPRTPEAVDASYVLIDGPWEHRLVAAGGSRFHVAELGEGPLVVLLHGFPQFWWAWRHQLVALAEGGFRVAAMDLRGYGASDKTPQSVRAPRARSLKGTRPPATESTESST